MSLKYNSDKFDSCLNTYRENFSNISKSEAQSPDQEYEASILIPLDFTLEMDGISGIIPNSAFEVPAKVLPNSYLTKKNKPKIAFILHTIEQNFSNNKWTTKLTGQTLNIRFDELSYDEKTKREKYKLQTTLSNLSYSSEFLPALDYPLSISNNVINTIPALTRLKNLIGTYESNNNYGVANTGGSAKKSTINVNGLTFGVLKSYQSIPNENDSKRVYASGRFQIIPSTMNSIKSQLGLKSVDRYDPITQERMGDHMLLTYRAAVGNYIKGKNQGNLQDLTSAINSIGYEWASMPVVQKSDDNRVVGDLIKGTGQSGNYGGRGNNPSQAKVSLKLMANTLISARILYGSKKPSFIPTYYNNFT